MTYYLGLGTNLGDKEANLHTAIREIGERVGRVTRVSSFLTTEPWGFVSENRFLNAVVEVESESSPMEVLLCTQAIEHRMGRTRKSTDGAYADRLIDIDILLCFTPEGESVSIDTPELRLPHPQISRRPFVTEPLKQLGVSFSTS